MSTQVVKMSAKYRRGLSSMLLNTTLHWPFFFTKRLRRRPVPRSRPRRHEGEARQLLWTMGSFVTRKDKVPLASSLPGHSPPPSSPRIQAPDSVCWVRGLWPLWRPRLEIFRASSSVETMLYLKEQSREKISSGKVTDHLAMTCWVTIHTLSNFAYIWWEKEKT